MKLHLFFIAFLLLSTKAPLLANYQEIAAVYHNEIPPVEHAKKAVKKEGKKFKKQPIIQKEQNLKKAGMVLLIVGIVVFSVFFTLFLVGSFSGGWGSIALVGFGAIFALLGLTALILGAIFLGVAKKKGL